MSDNYLVISAQGKDRPGIVNTLSKAALDSGCNITNSRMAVLGGEFALILLINRWRRPSRASGAARS